MKTIKPIASGICLPMTIVTLLATFQAALGWYDPSLQRWLTRDPIEERGDINLYRFARNDPVNRIDPWGMNSLVVDFDDNGAPIYVYGSRHNPFLQGDLNLDGVVTAHEFAEFIEGPWQGTDSPLGDLLLGGVGGAMRGGAFRVCPAAKSGASQLFPDYMRFRSQGFTPSQAKYLAQPYNGMGHHFIPRRWGMPQAITDSRFSVLKPPGITRGDFYSLHYRVDPNFYLARFPNPIGGSWSGRAIGLEKLGFIGRMWHGSPTPLKIGGGGGAAAGGGTAYWHFNNEN